jgi:hypothetical protein
MKLPQYNCIYFTKFGNCNHLDRRGWFGLGKSCIMNDPFVGSCLKQIPHKRPAPTPFIERKGL